MPQNSHTGRVRRMQLSSHHEIDSCDDAVFERCTLEARRTSFAMQRVRKDEKRRRAMHRDRMQTFIALSAAESGGKAGTTQAAQGHLARWVQRATSPMNDWSRRVLASAERTAAKKLWAASTSLGRFAHRLD